jgi:hypothetical protein
MAVLKKFKGRLVSNGFSQKEGTEYENIFSLLESLSLLLDFFIGNFTKWMLRLPFSMVKWRKNFILNILKVS